MPKRGLIAIAAAGALLAGCGSSQAGHLTGPAQTTRSSATTPVTRTAPSNAKVTKDRRATAARPQAVEPVAGAAPAATTSGTDADAVVSAGGSAQSGSLPHPQPVSEVRRELAASGMTAGTDQATLTSGGLAIAPVGAPAAVQSIIAAGNQISHLPYIWGGGHETYEDTGYDCSGSLSYVLAAAHLLGHTETSGQLESWGEPGPGKWITVFATDGHTFMYVAGLRFDTVALAETGTRWSNRSADEPDLSSFVERHPAGL